ncbi:MAG: CDP-alcohol phosphatidyltransferase family protein [Candidatus Rokubacteria bacterium]|nr:CDP-alcohol phosphatidyltransferase family protein [Candidatus Rokubacteria bacterium]
MSVDAALYFTEPGDVAHALVAVAGRPVAFRAVMAALRAGANRVFVPAALRATDVGRLIASHPSAPARSVWLDADTPVPDGPLLLLPAASFVTREVLRPVLASDGPVLVDRAAPNAAGGVVPAATVASVWARLVAGEPLGDAVRRALASDGRTRLEDQPFMRIASPADASRVSARLLASLGSPIDTPLDRALHRRLSRPCSLVAVRLGVTPNAITLLSLVVGLAAGASLAGGTLASALAGLALYVAAVVLDHSDGEVARLTFAESSLGEWLDVTADTVVHTLVVGAMGVAAQRAAGGGLVAGLVGGAGVIGSAWFVKTSPAAPETTNGLLDALANRDGFYAMLVLFVVSLAALPSALPVLMLVVAAGTNAYWLAWLVYRVRPARRAKTLRKPK